MFILGTANFGNDYAGSQTYVDASAAELIIREFVNSGGTKLDTAEVYGGPLDIIQKLSNFSLKIGTNSAQN